VAPSTPIEEVAPLLDAGVVDLVDVLAVEPGWGGQPFNPAVLDKVRVIGLGLGLGLELELGLGLGELRAPLTLSQVRWLRAHYPRLEHIMLDGGITAETARAAAAAGANVLVAGSYLFGSDDMAGSFDALEVRLTSTLALPLALPLALALPLSLPRTRRRSSPTASDGGVVNARDTVSESD